jgi:hypothetical protein
MSPLLFISHKHADHAIATAIRSFINEQSRGLLRVFQSSDATARTPKVARELNRELQKELWEAAAVVLVYTTADKDWDYCMWECGVATTPSNPEIPIIVFQCADHAPAVFNSKVRVDARTRAGIANFVTQFMTDKDFFPGGASPLTGFNAGSKEVESAISKFHSELAAVLPKGEASEWRPHPFLQVEINSATVKSIRDLPPAAGVAGAKALIESEVLISDSDSAAHRLFGLASFQEGLTLSALVSYWKDSCPGAPTVWTNALAEQIVKCARYEFPALQWTPMQPVPEDNRTQHMPVVSRVGLLPSGAMQIDIYFYPFTLLKATPVSARMIKRELMFCRQLAPGDENKIKVLELIRELNNRGIDRIPLLDNAGKVLYLTHRSLLERHITWQLAKDEMKRDATLADMFEEQPTFRAIVATAFGFVPLASTLAEVRTEMSKMQCRDIFVTRDGTRDQPVEGFITEEMIASEGTV